MGQAVRRRVSAVVAVLALGVPALPSAASASPPALLAPAASQSGFAVPRAQCGPGSSPETGLQGQVSLADQVSGRAMKGYRCNLELVGQYTGDGGAIQLAWYGDCAYMPTGYAFTDPEFEKRKGVVVIDASDPTRPRETTRLQSPAMVNPWESLKVSQPRGLLAAAEGGSFPLTGPGQAGPGFDTYDVKGDCRAPKLQASVDLPNVRGHEGDFAPDGKTYYQSRNQGAPTASVIAIDVSDPRRPKELGAYPIPGGIHGLSISEDGTRGYFMANNGTNGLMVFDLSEVQARRAKPQITLLSHLRWSDNSLTQIGRIVTIKGRKYLFANDEFGASISPQQSCQQGLPPWGYARIIDITDDRKPREVSKVRLEVNDPKNCATTLLEQNSAFALMYSAHYCDADDPKNTSFIACGWIASGVRVFDVRDPLKPKEVAYYVPPARLDTARGTLPWFGEAFLGTRTKDGVASQIRWKRAANGEMHLWFTSGMNGFQIVRFSNDAYPLAAAARPRTSTRSRAAASALQLRPAGAATSARLQPAVALATGASGTSTEALPATGVVATLPWLSLLLLAGTGLLLRRRRVPSH